VSLAGLAPAMGCGVVKSAPGAPSVPTSDASVGSSSGGTEPLDAANSCRPSDVQTFVQGVYQPAAAPSAACLGADGGGIWEDFYEACLGPMKSIGSCDTYKQTASNAACAACVLTPYTAAELGPILSFGEFVGGNVAGCIEVTAPSDIACAKAVQALTDCEDAACQANCPVSDVSSLTERQECAAEADPMGCLSFFDLASACRAAEADAGYAEPCMNSGFKDFYDVVVPLFCGQVNLDAAAVLDAGAADAGSEFQLDAELPPSDSGAD
jgi:hypothetical protein